jgi:WD40 repeat protein
VRNRQWQALLLSLIVTGPLRAFDTDQQPAQPPAPIKFGAGAWPGVVRGNHLLTYAEGGSFVALDVTNGRVCPFGTDVTATDVEGGKALAIERKVVIGDDGKPAPVASYVLRVVDLADGKVLQAIPYKDQPLALAFLGGGRLFAHRGNSLDLFDAVTGKPVGSINLGESEKLSYPSYQRPWQKAGDRLYVGGPSGKLCVIDLKSSKLIDQFEIGTGGSITSLTIEGDKAYVVYGLMAYNANTCWSRLVIVDLKTRKTTETSLRRAAVYYSRLLSGPGGTAFLVTGCKLEQFDASGQSIATLSAAESGQIVGAWKDFVLVADQDALRFVPVAALTSKTK